MTPQRDGRTYAQLRAHARPSALVADALGLLKERNGPALDIGAGALNNARLLLQRGCSVDAIDADPNVLALARDIGHRRLKATCADIRSVNIMRHAYALVVAIHVLPFLPRKDLFELMPRIIEGLKPGGILCCTLFGTGDAWAGNRPQMTFLDRPEIDVLLAPLQPLFVSEERYEGVDAYDQPKRWHLFRCLVRKC